MGRLLWVMPVLSLHHLQPVHKPRKETWRKHHIMCTNRKPVVYYVFSGSKAALVLDYDPTSHVLFVLRRDNAPISAAESQFLYFTKKKYKTNFAFVFLKAPAFLKSFVCFLLCFDVLVFHRRTSAAVIAWPY